MALSSRRRRWRVIAPGLCLVLLTVGSLSLGWSTSASAAGSPGPRPETASPPTPCSPWILSLTTGLEPAVGVAIGSYGSCGLALTVSTSSGATGPLGLNSSPPARLSAPIVGVAAASAGSATAFWLAGADGGVFALGGGGFFGSAADLHLQAPIVGIAATPDGRGYYLAAADGGVFAFGDAVFRGSMGGQHLTAPIVGISADPLTGGYRLVAADGGVFDFGAPFLGSMAGRTLARPIVGIATDGTTGGYLIAGSDGGVFAFGSTFDGSWLSDTSGPTVGIAWTPGGGYLLIDRSGDLGLCAGTCQG